MTPRYEVAEPDVHAAGPPARALWQRNLQAYTAEGAAAKLDKGYLNNPCRPGRIFLLAEAPGAPPCGTISLHPRRLWLDGRELRAAGLADFVVDEDHRALLPALKLARHGVAAGIADGDLVYVTPNERAAPVIRLSGMKPLGAMERHARPLRSAGFLARRLPRLAAAALAPWVDAGLRARDALAATMRGAGWRGEDAALDDARVDALWQRRPAGLLMSERTPAMLAWRFTGRTRGDGRLWLARDASGQPAGYVVWRTREGFCEVLDFLVADSLAAVGPLLLAFARWIRRQGAHSVSVEFFGAPAVVAQVADAGFARRPGSLPVLAAWRAGGPAVEADGWYMTRFDDDTD